jgi:DNA-binding transcriptional MerR regulator
VNISDAAAATGLTVDTIRYYDKIGILGPLARTGTGARDFAEGDLGWLRVLRCLRETGMTMADLRRFCAVDGDVDPGRRRTILEQHREAVLARLERTRQELTVIEGKIAAYRRAEQERVAVTDVAGGRSR